MHFTLPLVICLKFNSFISITAFETEYIAVVSSFCGRPASFIFILLTADIHILSSCRSQCYQVIDAESALQMSCKHWVGHKLKTLHVHVHWYMCIN